LTVHSGLVHGLASRHARPALATHRTDSSAVERINAYAGELLFGRVDRSTARRLAKE
jgi:hypothetical protein